MTIELLSSGMRATVQEWPGRLGYRKAGVPPSGPMDARSFRLGNRLVGNAQGTAGIEITLSAPRMRFAHRTIVAVTGAPVVVEIDGITRSQWVALDIEAGGELKLGSIRGAGMRAYVLVRGGIERPAVLGSRATFRRAGLGGGVLRKGDRLEIGDAAVALPIGTAITPPAMTSEWALRVLPGPYGAPDLLSADGLEELWAATWTAHLDSDRTAIRLTGPQPGWTRGDGGEAGPHPSNILDSAYGIGTLMLAGDTAAVVGPDGPTLGGFAAIAQVIRGDLWRLGQIRAGDAVTLDPVDPVHAGGVHDAAEAEIASLPQPPPKHRLPSRRRPPAPILDAPRDGGGGPMTFRRAGEGAVLVEFGEALLDLRSRVRVHLLGAALEEHAPAGLLDLGPGVRSLLVEHDPARLATSKLLELLVALEAQLPAPDATSVPARVVHLPLAWRDPLAMSAIARYESVRPDAPWCPDNIEFIRRVNGLRDEAAVRDVVVGASYLVLALGAAPLGGPLALARDPRHRLVAPPCEPARAWTPSDAVGIGGAFLRVSGTAGPGADQLVGRTIPIWHPDEDPPWRLRHFDELRFGLVEADELAELRAASAARTWAPRVETGRFSLAEHGHSLKTTP